MNGSVSLSAGNARYYDVILRDYLRIEICIFEELISIAITVVLTSSN